MKNSHNTITIPQPTWVKTCEIKQDFAEWTDKQYKNINHMQLSRALG